ncbi:MAG: PKD domain-containing protein [Chitinispirillaceae bacterium]|nr:PKD domain-containing protein [Chitinispirillaceae bacterium]
MHRVSALLVLFFLLTCAIRENPYDPQSPLHNAPNLSVNLLFDRSHVLGQLGDSLYAEAPLAVTLECFAHDFYSSSETISVDFSILHENRLLTYRHVKKEVLRLTERGTHRLHFSAQANNGAVSEKTFTIFLDTRDKPRFLSFSCSPDTFPLVPSIGNREISSFSISIHDPFSLLSHIVVDYGNFNSRIHDKTVFTRKDDTLSLSYSDSLLYPVIFYGDTVIPVTAVLFDSLNRTDTSTFNLAFTKSKYRGVAPPRIDSIYIENRPDTIFEDAPVCFNVAAYDPPENDSTPADTSLVYFWDVGDDTYLAKKNYCYTYYNPGTYTVKVTVTDDSMNTCTDSITITVAPRSVKPNFTYFLVRYESATAPCTLYVSATAISATGTISGYKIEFNNSNPQLVDVPQLVDWEYILTQPDTYNLSVTAIDEKGNDCDTSFTIVVTE